MDLLLGIDYWLFQQLNQGFGHPVLDVAFVWMTNPLPWLIAAAVGAGWLVWKYRKIGALFVLVVALGIGATDVLNSRVMKLWFQRERPCWRWEHVRLLVPCGKGYAFPSSHAANAFCAATLLAWGVRRWQWMWWTCAILIAVSRVYCGVHFPADVVAGALEGSSIAGLWIVGIRQTALGAFPKMVWESKMEEMKNAGG